MIIDVETYENSTVMSVAGAGFCLAGSSATGLSGVVVVAAVVTVVAAMVLIAVAS